ncbi:hypothetical protein R2601_03248 [Salipiger bermudensis HTCC2601]|uniref:Uncharacterized protein n=1 Tax=Salipiger bermudensis (strain DSM 26914 / JCM 13377 / KCTC 12554 / HTCC2601) TaxID=314265 RepID=Q0FWJ6_SALBH|nr:hypothetical protein R2601_03248 [Salipiger bermudensis HTCC2601]
MACRASSSPPRTIRSATTTRPRGSITRRLTGQTASTACRRSSARRWRASTTTSSGRRARWCASAPARPSPRTGACWRPGSAKTISSR